MSSVPGCDQGLRSAGLFTACGPIPQVDEPDCNCVATLSTGAPHAPVLGFADIHAHQFSNVGFGGVLFAGAPYHPDGISAALRTCDFIQAKTILPDVAVFDVFDITTIPTYFPGAGSPQHGPFGILDLTNNVRNELLGHSIEGVPDFDGWPAWNQITHQQMYYRWLERAFKGGLRLMVMLAVNNEVLCGAASTREGFGCDDMSAVDRQLDGAYGLQSYIDAQSGGPGKGWYRIVRTPEEARAAINGGKMAVVLGIEVDSLFNCGAEGCHDRNGTLISAANAPDYVRQELARYYDRGVRHIFPVHVFDNAFGGASIYDSLFNVGNKVVNGSYFDAVTCTEPGYDFALQPDPLGIKLATAFFGTNSTPPVLPAGPHCNDRGLTPLGETLITELMNRKMMIDVDHLSLKSLNRTLEMAEARNYPLVVGHIGFREMAAPGGRTEGQKTPEQLARLRDLGSLIGPGLGSSERFLENYKYAVEQMSGGPYSQPAVAMGTDLNGFVNMPPPRYPGSTPLDGNHVTYPFSGHYGGSFSRQITGNRTFDINRDGLAHVGLLPDLIEDMKKVQAAQEAAAGEDEVVTPLNLDPLFNSAEMYIQMWEKIGVADAPTTTATLSPPPNEAGWNNTQVTVTMTATASANGGGVESITYSGSGAETFDADTRHRPTAELFLTKEGKTTVSYHARDVLPGLIEPMKSVVVRIDKTAPVATVELFPVANENGWHNEQVRVVFSAIDPTLTTQTVSGIEDCDGPLDVAMEGAGQSRTGRCRDVAGNLSAIVASGEINIDLTDPMLTVPEPIVVESLIEGVPASEPAIAAFLTGASATDNLDSEPAVGVDLETAEGGVKFFLGDHEIKFFATDQADNTAILTSTISIVDTSPPVIEPTVTGTKGDGDWYIDDVTVSWSVTDPGSAITETSGCEESVLSTDSAGTSYSCTATSAGGTDSVTVTVERDTTAPEIELVARTAANDEGWNNEAVTLEWSCTDATSGVVTELLSETLTEEGATQSATGTCRDHAGHTTSHTESEIHIDLTQPEIALVARTSANGHGWNNESVSLEWSCTDALSGVVAKLLSQTFGTEGADQSATATCVDLADNTKSHTETEIHIDLTPPVVAFVARTAPNEHGWNNGDVAIQWSCSDGLSGPIAPFLSQTLTGEGANQSASATCADFADNTASGIVDGIHIDLTAPLLACVAAPDSIWPPNHQMVPVTVTIDLSDALSGPLGFTLDVATSDEPDQTGEKDDLPDDMQQFALTTADTEGLVRAERFSEGDGRLYTFGYGATDLAGNQALPCATTVTVLHDKR
ncbi:MAG: hypothetical protein ACRD2J_11860 [Thermoanaerobaculia bacterium]